MLRRLCVAALPSATPPFPGVAASRWGSGWPLLRLPSTLPWAHDWSTGQLQASGRLMYLRDAGVERAQHVPCAASRQGAPAGGQQCRLPRAGRQLVCMVTACRPTLMKRASLQVMWHDSCNHIHHPAVSMALPLCGRCLRMALHPAPAASSHLATRCCAAWRSTRTATPLRNTCLGSRAATSCCPRAGGPLVTQPPPRAWTCACSTRCAGFMPGGRFLNRVAWMQHD